MRLVDARELRARLIKDLEHAHLAVQQPKQQTAFQLFAASLSLSMTDKPEEVFMSCTSVMIASHTIQRMHSLGFVEPPTADRGSLPLQRINAVKLKVKEADLAISDAETGLQEATQSTSDEIRRFHRTSVHDVKNLLVDYAKSQVKRQCMRVFCVLSSLLDGPPLPTHFPLSAALDGRVPSSSSSS